MRECFDKHYGVPLTTENILGILSILFWSLVIVISLKYLLFVMRADNRGEGGVLALMALTHHVVQKPNKKATAAMMFLGLFGAALLYGDGMITPVISVLSAVEGLKVGTPFFEPYVLPITIAILILIFLPQRFGTGRIGTIFGPIILLWFLSMGLLGASWVVHEPRVLSAVSPLQAIGFFVRHGWVGFSVLGAVILVVTGGEALYADMGHFGRRPIRFGWFAVAFPALVINYFGQGALLIGDPGAIENPFYHMVPEWALYPMVALATISAIIASQAVISGSFSLTRQAVQLGYLPRLVINHTSSEEIGQIYVPRVNWALLIATIWLALEFRTSTNLAAAYGVAVSTTMVITTILIYSVARHLWGWSVFRTVLVIGFFVTIDFAFFASNIIKIKEGGWFPLAIAGLIFTLMTTWRKGREILAQRLKARAIPLDTFVESIRAQPPTRVAGTAVFMTGTLQGTPPALLHNVKHNKVLHERVVLMKVKTEDVPHVPIENRVTVDMAGGDIYKVVARYGFKDSPNVPAVLQIARSQGLDCNPSDTTFFLGRETLLATQRPGMAIWREKLFAVMSANAERATAFFRIPPEQVVEIGIQVEL